MRILVHFRGEVLQNRGTPLRCRNLVQALSRRPDMEVTLFSRDSSEQLNAVLPVDHESEPDPARVLDRLRSVIARIRPHVIYAQTSKAAIDLAKVPPRAGARVVDLHGDLALQKLEDPGRSIIRRVRGYLSARMSDASSFRRVDGWTVVSQELAAKVARRGKPVQLLLGGVDPEVFRPDLPDRSALIRVGYVGSYRAYHGIPDVLAAGAELVKLGHPFHFVLAGDIDQVPGMRRQAQMALGDRVTILGPVAYSEVPKVLGQCDILVVPRRAQSSAKYNYPSKLSEFLAMGKAVVVTDVGQAGRVVQHMNTGLVVPAGSPTGLAQAFLILKDSDLRHRLGQAARSFAVRQLTWDRIGEQLADFLARVARASVTTAAGESPK